MAVDVPPAVPLAAAVPDGLPQGFGNGSVFSLPCWLFSLAFGMVKKKKKH